MDKDSWLKKISKADTIDKFSSIVDFCQGKRVLDVGCIGQDKSFESEAWLHGRIKKVASRLVGSDINEDGINMLNDEGYEIYTPEKLSALNEKFDLIVMGDVIEHVNDPGAFLSFYAQFLNTDGKMIICTPNAFGVRYFIQVLTYGKPGTNEEHTVFFDPMVSLELFSRIGLNPTSFYWLKEYRGGQNWKQKIILMLSNILIFFRKYFSANFMYIVEKA